MPSLTIPGKILLMGEYGVIEGGQALFAAVKPGYTFASEPSQKTAAWVHPESPLGIYLRESETELSLTSASSASMGLGFGSSTAELVAGAITELGRTPETKRVWAWYREFFPKASGADLVVQLEAYRTGQAFFEYQNGQASILAASKLFSEIEVFQVSPAQKLATHTDLDKGRAKLDLAKLNSLVQKLRNAFLSNERTGLTAFTEFADALHDLGLETEFAHQVREEFFGVTGVNAVKGCGAGLNDVYVVACDPEEIEPSDLEEVADKFSLKALGNLGDLLW